MALASGCLLILLHFNWFGGGLSDCILAATTLYAVDVDLRRARLLLLHTGLAFGGGSRVGINLLHRSAMRES